MFINGISASPGIAIHKAFLYVKEEVEVQSTLVEDVDKEIQRLEDALAAAKGQLEAIKEKAAVELSPEEAEIFEAHIMVLEDPEFTGGILAEIKDNRFNAEYAVQTVTQRLKEIFEMMEDDYFRARAADIQDVGTRVLNNVAGIETIDLSAMEEDVIIIAEDLAPSDTAQMDKNHVKGFATDIGSRTSHTAIMARSLEIPAVLGLGDITSKVQTGDTIVIDGQAGVVIVNPTAEETAEYQNKKEAYETYVRELSTLKEQPGETLDGHRVELVGNIGSPEDVEGVIRNGGEGVGLYRTEFLYMDSDTMPDEESQTVAYQKVLESFEGNVIIRTLDIGGDKHLPYLPMEEEMNPFLGLRAIRLCLKERELFKTQLRAILRASVKGKAHIMFPMISGVKEVLEAKAVLKEVMAELDKEGIPYDPDIKVGIMVEIPSAAVTADIIAPEVDFFSIGTNDLCQYTLAVDRMNQQVSYLYDPLHPAILRLVKNVIDASRAHPGVFTGMCGEMAGDPYAVPILLGLGLDEFSMSASSIPLAKKIIRSMRLEEAQQLAEKALHLTTGEEVKELVKNKLEELNIVVM